MKDCMCHTEEISKLIFFIIIMEYERELSTMGCWQSNDPLIYLRNEDYVHYLHCLHLTDI